MCPIKPVETEESCMSESPKKKKKKDKLLHLLDKCGWKV